MKIRCIKAIVIEIVLAFAVAVMIYCAVKFMDCVEQVNGQLDYIYKVYDEPNKAVASLIARYTQERNEYLSCAIPLIIAVITTFAAMVTIAISEIPAIRTAISHFKTRHVERKKKQAAIAKQERIAKLEAELDELKKDE